MKTNLLKSIFLAGIFLSGTALFAETHFSIGVGIGSPGYYGPAYYDGYYAAPPPPPPVYVAPSPYPGPGYAWVDGYWYPAGGRYMWHAGYWARPPYAGGYWVAPRYYRGRYYNGYWGRGDRDHDGIPNRYDHYDNRRGYGYGYRR